MYVEPFNQDQVRVAPCCQAAASDESIHDFDFYSNSTLQKIRQQIDNNQQPYQCQRCWKAEATGSHSRRQSMLDEYHLKSPNTNIELKSLDINVTWACNLACVMCGPNWSSTWAKELDVRTKDRALLGRQSRQRNPFIDQLDLTEIKRVHFNGGEPLINHDHYDVLCRLQQAGVLNQTAISYNTNGTQYPDDAVIDLWQQAKLVKIYFSIDAIGDQFEYIRWPADWSQVNANIVQMREHMPSNVMFGINATVGCYNVFEVGAVWDWFDKTISTNRELDPSDFNWQFANSFDVSMLTVPARIAAIEYLKQYSVFQGVINHLQSTDLVPSTDWIDKFDTIDQRRHTNWRDVLAVATYY